MSIATFDVLDILAALVDKSLVVFEENESGGQGRYRLMETVRQYAADRMTEMDAPDVIVPLRQKHADYFFRFAHDAVPKLQSGQQAEWLAYLTSESDNVRAALDWLSFSRPPDALQLAADLTGFWNARALLSEGRTQFTRLLNAPETQVALPLLTPDTEETARKRAQAANGAGTLATLQADYTEAVRLHNEALHLFGALSGGDAQGEGDALHGLGSVVFYEQRYDDARALWEQCLQIREGAGDTRRIASTLHNLGNLAMREDRYVDAHTLFNRALALRRTLGEPTAIAGTLGALGQLAFIRDDYREARRYMGETLRTFSGLGVWWAVALCLSDLSRVAEEQADLVRATRLLSASSRLRETVGFPHPPAEQKAERERKENLLQAAGEADFSAAWAQGQAGTNEEAVAFALKV